jgi:hypothetical protein
MTSGRALRRGAPAVLLRLRGPPLVLALALALALLLVLPLGPATALAAAGARSARRRFEARTGSKTRLAGDTSELTSCRGRARQPDAARGRRARHDARSHRRRSPGRRTRCPRRTADEARERAPASHRTALLAPQSPLGRRGCAHQRRRRQAAERRAARLVETRLCERSVRGRLPMQQRASGERYGRERSSGGEVRASDG